MQILIGMDQFGYVNPYRLNWRMAADRQISDAPYRLKSLL